MGIFGLLLLAESISNGNMPCDQKVYDQIYREISFNAIKTEDYDARRNAIEILRKLCKGQLSSYEKPNQP